MSDVRISNNGSIILVTPLTDEARSWIDDHVDSEAQWFGPALVVEPRYLEPLLDGMAADGLEVAP